MLNSEPENIKKNSYNFIEYIQKLVLFSLKCNGTEGEMDKNNPPNHKNVSGIYEILTTLIEQKRGQIKI